MNCGHVLVPRAAGLYVKPGFPPRKETVTGTQRPPLPAPHLVNFDSIAEAVFASFLSIQLSPERRGWGPCEVQWACGIPQLPGGARGDPRWPLAPAAVFARVCQGPKEHLPAFSPVAGFWPSSCLTPQVTANLSVHPAEFYWSRDALSLTRCYWGPARGRQGERQPNNLRR